MQDNAARWLREVVCGGRTAFGNITSALYLVTDVHTFVCVTRLDGDRRFEGRFSRKISLSVQAHCSGQSAAYSLHYCSLRAQK